MRRIAPEMTPDRFAEIMDACCWSSRDLGAILDEDDRMIRRMRAGREAIPPSVASWMEIAWSVIDMAPQRRELRRTKKEGSTSEAMPPST